MWFKKKPPVEPEKTIPFVVQLDDGTFVQLEINGKKVVDIIIHMPEKSFKGLPHGD